MVFIRGDRTLFGKTGQGGPWNQLSGANAATAVAVNANGLVLMIGTDNAIYSRGITGSWDRWMDTRGRTWQRWSNSTEQRRKQHDDVPSRRRYCIREEWGWQSVDATNRCEFRHGHRNRVQWT